MNNTKLKSIASEVLKQEGQELLDAADRIAESVVKSSDIISNHSGKVVLCGMGKSGLIAQKIAATLCSIGNKAVFLHAAPALGDAYFLGHVHFVSMLLHCSSAAFLDGFRERY